MSCVFDSWARWFWAVCFLVSFFGRVFSLSWVGDDPPQRLPSTHARHPPQGPAPTAED